MQGLGSWETNEGMNFTIGFCFFFFFWTRELVPNVRSHCQGPTGMKPTCLFLLLAFSMKAETIGSLIYMHACVCICTLMIELELAKESTCFIQQNVLSTYQIPTFWNCSLHDQNFMTEKCGFVTIIWIKGRDGILLRSLSKVLWDDKLPSRLWAKNREGNGVIENFVFSIVREDVKLINFKWE